LIFWQRAWLLREFVCAVKVAQYSFLKYGKFTIWMRIFEQLLLADKRKVPYLYKTISKEFEFLHKRYATIRTFQNGGYFSFKVI
jgi:hypothetical protein